jgi:hypothetical protein
VVFPLSDNEPGDDTLSSGRQNAGDESEPGDAEITPEKELGV